jgi:arsenate reductase (thioredoxin)
MSLSKSHPTPIADHIGRYINLNALAFAEISTERKTKLAVIADYIRSKIAQKQTAELVYICTHNSRRSHFGQIWAATAAAFYGLERLVKTYSGGTEATACNERTLAALEKAGFSIERPTQTANPKYLIQYAPNGPKQLAFSKKYDDEANPSNGFCAIMTCTSADEACPVVLGASFRIATPYNDPKIFDDTPVESAMYDERCKQIALETFYIFSEVGQP